ncbi:DUF1904 family protein [Niallia oryzisoli]|uniref:DUF1904 family protein n=1 Tax=Niallia oryzisoli TaxID=1737571 RepID=A0ABZ2CNH9_9BACI
MPHLVIRGVSIEEMKRISMPLVGELAEICECGTDNFTFEVPHSTFVFDGEETQAFPLIEVKWFERGQEIRDRFAQSVTKHIMSTGAVEIEVVFIPFSEPAYYINGERVGN